MKIFVPLVLILSIQSGVFGRRKKRSHASTKRDDDNISITDVLKLATPEVDLPSMLQRRLLLESLRPAMLTENYASFDPSLGKAFPKEVLIYVTPWNRKGYDIAKHMASKVSWVAPVWFTAKFDESSHGRVAIEGELDVNKPWLDELQALRRNRADLACDASQETCATADLGHLQIVPRVVIGDDRLLDTNVGRMSLTARLLELQRTYGFDGFTVEGNLNAWQSLVIVLRELRERDCRIVLVAPAFGGAPDDAQFTAVVDALFSAADRVSVMTYDYSKGSSLGPNAPLSWVADILGGLTSLRQEYKQKILMGLPMYGWRGGTEAMIADTMVVWMHEGGVSIEWDEYTKEHTFVNEEEGRSSSFPTPLFVQLRLDLAKEMDLAGVALWEVGQMMPMLIDLF